MNIENAKQIAEYIQKSAEMIDSLQNQVTTLETEKENLEKLAGQDKEASVKEVPIGLDAGKVTETVGTLVKAGFVKEAEQELAIESFTKDPSTVLKFLGKMAAREVEAAEIKPLGRASGTPLAPKSGDRESDQAYESHFTKLASKI